MSTLADEFAAIAKAAFIAGAISEVKKRGKKAGKAAVSATVEGTVGAAKAVKRKVTPYQRRLGIEMRRLKRLHKKKNGDWKKGWDNKRWMAASHAATKKVMK